MKILRSGTILTSKILFATSLFVASAGSQSSHQTVTAIAAARPTVSSNVIYGMFSGLALLLDVYRPVQPNGRGILFVPGSGWATTPDFGALPLKDEREQLRLFVEPLVSAGYVVFVINYRVAPQFHYPASVEDAARAVRFIRYRATQYGIDPGRIGAVGYSSGANLTAMLDVKGDSTGPEGQDSIGRQSARIQCAVGVGTPANLMSPSVPAALQILSAYLGVTVKSQATTDSKVHNLLVNASPISYVASGDAPMLFIHGTMDSLVPIANVEDMVAALSKAGVTTKLVKITGASHWPLDIRGAPDIGGTMAEWLDKCLSVRRRPEQE